MKNWYLHSRNMRANIQTLSREYDTSQPKAVAVADLKQAGLQDIYETRLATVYRCSRFHLNLG